MERDSIDLGKANVSSLFRIYFLPTLLGMLSMCIVTAIDGIFIGHGVGSEGVAAVNIAIAPTMLLVGFALMLGMGCSVVSSIHLSRGYRHGYQRGCGRNSCDCISRMVRQVSETYQTEDFFEEPAAFRQKHRLSVKNRRAGIAWRNVYGRNHVHGQSGIHALSRRQRRWRLRYRLLLLSIYLYDRQCHSTIGTADNQFQFRNRTIRQSTTDRKARHHHGLSLRNHSDSDVCVHA